MFALTAEIASVWVLVAGITSGLVRVSGFVSVIDRLEPVAFRSVQ